MPAIEVTKMQDFDVKSLVSKLFLRVFEPLYELIKDVTLDHLLVLRRVVLGKY